MTYLVWAIGLAAIVVGFLGTILPALPGTPMIFMGVWLIAWWTDYAIISGPSVILLAFLGAAGFVVDVIASALGARQVGASRAAIVGASVGSIAGIAFALPGMIIGPFIGGAVGQFYSERSVSRATKVGIATWVGVVVGTAAKLAIAIGMVLTFASTLLL